MATFVVVAIIIVMAGIAIRSIIRDKKNGVSCHCGRNCQNCMGGCSVPQKKTEKGTK